MALPHKGVPHYPHLLHQCLDKNPGSVPGSAPDKLMMVKCSTIVKRRGMPCPPCDPQKELCCAVCIIIKEVFMVIEQLL